jgi:hypothetical protein
MNQTEFIYFVVLILVILAAPFVPTSLLLFLDNLVVRIAVVILLLFMMNQGPTVGLFCFMTIALLFLERNRRKVEDALRKLDAMEPPRMPQATVEEASRPQQTVPVPEFDAPEQDEMPFLPQEDALSEFEPVAPSMNQKAVLSSIYSDGSASATQHIYEQLGFGHVM